MYFKVTNVYGLKIKGMYFKITLVVLLYRKQHLHPCALSHSFRVGTTILVDVSLTYSYTHCTHPHSHPLTRSLILGYFMVTQVCPVVLYKTPHLILFLSTYLNTCSGFVYLPPHCMYPRFVYMPQDMFCILSTCLRTACPVVFI